MKTEGWTTLMRVKRFLAAPEKKKSSKLPLVIEIYDEVKTTDRFWVNRRGLSAFPHLWPRLMRSKVGPIFAKKIKKIIIMIGANSCEPFATAAPSSAGLIFNWFKYVSSLACLLSVLVCTSCSAAIQLYAFKSDSYAGTWKPARWSKCIWMFHIPPPVQH